jgi:hypothetical protein
MQNICYFCDNLTQNGMLPQILAIISNVILHENPNGVHRVFHAAKLDLGTDGHNVVTVTFFATALRKRLTRTLSR